MFEHIHFIEESPSLPYTERTTPYSTDTTNVNQAMTNVINGKATSFYISGSFKYLPMRPYSPFALEHLLYMQHFCIFYEDEHYFTRRSNCESYILIFTHEGKGLLEYKGRNIPLTKNTLVFIDSQKPHLYRTDGPSWVLSCFHINGNIAPFIARQLDQDNKILFRGNICDEYLETLEEILTVYQDFLPYHEFKISNLISDLMLGLLQYKYEGTVSSSQEGIQYLVTYMSHNYPSDINLDTLSQLAGMSKYHMSREFRRLTGFTPHDYLIQLRIDRAKFLLGYTDMSIKEIAGAVGFSDTNYFSVMFKKKTGFSPKQYSKRSG